MKGILRRISVVPQAGKAVRTDHVSWGESARSAGYVVPVLADSASENPGSLHLVSPVTRSAGSGRYHSKIEPLLSKALLDRSLEACQMIRAGKLHTLLLVLLVAGPLHAQGGWRTVRPNIGSRCPATSEARSETVADAS